MTTPDVVIVEYSTLPNFARAEVQFPAGVVATNPRRVLRCDLTEEAAARRHAEFVYRSIRFDAGERES